VYNIKDMMEREDEKRKENNISQDDRSNGANRDGFSAIEKHEHFNFFPREDWKRFKKHVSFIHDKWLLSDVLSGRIKQTPSNEKKSFFKKIYDSFATLSFLKRKKSLEDKLKESLEDKRNLELDVKKLSDYVSEFEKHVSDLEKTESEAKAVLCSLDKNEDSIKNPKQRRDTERRRWQSYKTLHFVEEKRFEMLGLLKESNTKLRSLHKA